jgi:hypothetical protein
MNSSKVGPKPKWASKIIFGSIVMAFASGSAAWCGWVTMSLAAAPTKNDVGNIVRNTAPFIRHEQYILNEVGKISKIKDDIAQIKIELAKISSKLEKL